MGCAGSFSKFIVLAGGIRDAKVIEDLLRALDSGIVQEGRAEERFPDLS